MTPYCIFEPELVGVGTIEGVWVSIPDDVLLQEFAGSTVEDGALPVHAVSTTDVSMVIREVESRII